ncbi:hypothetical protein C481_13814 [Natrialba asiatica DSM 12278]|uniref:Uncharacterized protein n=1 Tax=Natrialba asiatica (strain ATCC 700177 / DSM 12278 / JCM 9576 / FERM P-10747 / NBRC 102637 / 172P1) TaxID=29540 RepID=M0AP38_NATA1|nr:hypothetical protein C481_13814 [Natrialba asiatica DSM 12278]
MSSDVADPEWQRSSEAVRRERLHEFVLFGRMALTALITVGPVVLLGGTQRRSFCGTGSNADKRISTLSGRRYFTTIGR